MPEPEINREVTEYHSPEGKRQFFKRGCQPDGWTLDDSAAKANAAKAEEQTKAERQKEIDDAVAAELARRDAVLKQAEYPSPNPAPEEVQPGEGDGTLKNSDPEVPDGDGAADPTDEEIMKELEAEEAENGQDLKTDPA